MELQQPTLKAVSNAAEDQAQARQAEAESHRAQFEQDQQTLALEASATLLEEEAARQELELERETLREERREAARRFGEQLTELQSLRAELERERAAIQAERAAWQEQIRSRFVEPVVAVEPVCEAVADEIADEEAVAVADDEQEVEAAEEIMVAASEPERRARSEVSAAPASDEEQSIEEYMAALLHRTRGGSSPAPVIVSQPKRNKRKSDGATSADQRASDVVAATAPVVEQQCVVDMPSVAMEMTRRSPAEKTDLSAMRALCNIQARNAISTHGKKRLMKNMLTTSTLALASLMVTVLVLQLSSAEHNVIRTGAMAGMVVAVFWAYSAGTAAHQLLAWRRSHEARLKENQARASAKKEESSANVEVGPTA